MAKSKTYELLLKIGGRTDSSLKAACLAADKNLSDLGNAAKTAGKVAAGAMLATVAAVGTLGVAAVNAAATYEAQLSNVATLLTGTEEQVAARTSEIGDQILAVSNRTGVATDNLTDGMYQVISAFGDGAEAAGILETAAKAAAAGNSTTTDAINLLSAVTKGYGDTSAEAVQKAADLSFATVRLGQTSFPELAGAMGKVIPLAGTLGVEQEQLFGAMSTLTGVTGGTAEVVTQLKATMQGFLAPNANMTKSLKAMGYESGQALLQSEGLQGAMETLKGSVGGNDLAFAGLFSSVEAQTAVLALAGTQAENLTSKTAEMYQATGAADTAFMRQTDNLKYMGQEVKNLGNNFLTELGMKALPCIKDFAEDALPVAQEMLEKIGGYLVDTVIPAVQDAVGWVQENKNVLIMVAGAIAAVVLAYKVAKGALTVYNTVMAIQEVVSKASAAGTLTLSGAVQGLNMKMLAIVGVIGLVVGAAIWLYQNWDTVKQKAAELGAKIGEIWSNISNAVNNAIAAISERFPMLGAYLQGFWDSIQAAWGNVQAIFSNIIDFISNVFAGNWGAAWDNIVAIFGNIFGAIVNIAKAPINGIISAINFVIGKINSMSFTFPDWVPGLGGETWGFVIPEIPQLAAGGIATGPTLAEIGEGGEPEAVLPLSKLAALLDGWTKKPKPNGGGMGGDGDSIVWSPVFNFYGPTTREDAVEAGRISFTEFKRLYKQMKAEERRKAFTPA